MVEFCVALQNALGSLVDLAVAVILNLHTFDAVIHTSGSSETSAALNMISIEVRVVSLATDPTSVIVSQIMVLTCLNSKLVRVLLVLCCIVLLLLRQYKLVLFHGPLELLLQLAHPLSMAILSLFQLFQCLISCHFSLF